MMSKLDNSFDDWFKLHKPHLGLSEIDAEFVFKAGQQSMQKEIDELNLTIKRLITSEEDIARGCKHWRDSHRELDERVGYILKVCENLKNDSLRENHKEYDKGWRDCASSILHQLR